MKLDDVIGDIDQNIFQKERIIQSLKNEKLKFQRIKEQYPQAHFEGRSLCINDIWDKITCMRMEQKRKYYRQYNAIQINAKFLLSKRHSIEGMSVYTFPFENEIAEIRYTYGTARKKEILIRDYKNIIPLNCPKRNSFIKRIKLHLINRITKENLSIDPNSYDKDDFNKLILLR